VFLNGTNTGIAGARVEFRVKLDGRWIPSGSVVVGADGYFGFSYPIDAEEIAIEQIVPEGYQAVSAQPVVGGRMVNETNLLHVLPGGGQHCSYIFYDTLLGSRSDCGCVDFVVFHTNRDGNWELYRLNPGMAGAPLNLSRSSAWDMAPSIAPNSDIAFQSNRDGNWEIYLVNELGQNPTRLTNNGADDIDPVWSPDCRVRRLAFQSNRDGHWEIYVSGGTPNSERRITRSDGDSMDPYWSPDGQQLVYQSNRGGGWDLYIINVDTLEERRLTNFSAQLARPTATRPLLPTATATPMVAQLLITPTQMPLTATPTQALRSATPTGVRPTATSLPPTAVATATTVPPTRVNPTATPTRVPPTAVPHTATPTRTSTRQ
jgi:hypothetical protein